MPKLVYTVEVDDEENGLEYLIALQKAFVAVTDLQSWGYTGDECSSSSIIEVEEEERQEVFDQEIH